MPNVSLSIEYLSTYTCPNETNIVFAHASLLYNLKESLRNLFKSIYNNLSLGGHIRISIKYAETNSEVIEEDSLRKRIFYYYSERILKKLGKSTLLFL
jgi:hypothetical protein